MTFRLFSAILLALALATQPAYAGWIKQCIQSALHFAGSGAERLKLDQDPLRQWLLWEATGNIEKMQKSIRPAKMSLVEVSPDEVNVYAVNDLPDYVKSVFFKDKRILWPKHPYNTDKSVPFFARPETAKQAIRWTASRSMAVTDRGKHPLFTLKVGTDRLVEDDQIMGAEKTRLTRDILGARFRTPYIDRMDQEIGRDPEMEVLREVLSVEEKTSKNGFVVRDLAPLRDGNYYLPAFSIPHSGWEIARQNGQSFEAFWKESYAKPLGRAKAKLLLRYGLQMVTPNAQNMLIQLDRDLKPTGKIFFRDISDSLLVEPVARALGQEAELASNKAATIHTTDQLNIMTDNSFWRMDEPYPKGKSVPNETLSDWKMAHDQAYIEEICQALGWDPGMVRNVNDLGNRLFSDEGNQALAVYSKKLRGKG